MAILCAVVLVILVSFSASSSLNHRLACKRDSAVSIGAEALDPPRARVESEPSMEEANSSRTEDGVPGNDHVSSREILNDANKTCENSLQNGKSDSPASSEIPPEEVPIPDGRIFYDGEPPYGYLPTCSPKQSILVPILPLEPD